MIPIAPHAGPLAGARPQEEDTMQKRTPWLIGRIDADGIRALAIRAAGDPALRWVAHAGTDAIDRVLARWAEHQAQRARERRGRGDA